MNHLTHFGQYDHSDRNLLILGIIFGIIAITWIIGKRLGK